jgi:hypothetical protein
MTGQAILTNLPHDHGSCHRQDQLLDRSLQVVYVFYRWLTVTGEVVVWNGVPSPSHEEETPV